MLPLKFLFCLFVISSMGSYYYPERYSGEAIFEYLADTDSLGYDLEMLAIKNPDLEISRRAEGVLKRHYGYAPDKRNPWVIRKFERLIESASDAKYFRLELESRGWLVFDADDRDGVYWCFRKDRGKR